MIFVSSGLNQPLFPSIYVIAPPKASSSEYNLLKNSVFIAFSEVCMAGITSEEVIEPPKKLFFSINKTLSPNFPAV